MNRRRLIIWSLVTIACIAGISYRYRVLNASPEIPAPRVVFVTGGSEPFWQLTADGAKAAAQKFNVKLQVKMPNADESLEEQATILGDLKLAELDGIALSPLDADGQSTLINQFVSDGKKVVTFDSDAPQSSRQCHIGASNFTAGRICAGLVNDAIPNGGKIAVLLANLTKDNIQDRKNGFQERIAQFADDVPEGSPLKFVVVEYMVDNGNTEKCEKNIRDVLAKSPDLAAFVGLNAKHGPILLEVLEELDQLGKIKLVTFDETEETLKGIESGHIYATMAQDPYRYGYAAVATLATLCSGDEESVPIVGRGSTYLSAEAIRQDNVGDFRKRLEKRQQSISAKKGQKKAA
jgi:ribose transport system substrate-binding protein